MRGGCSVSCVGGFPTDGTARAAELDAYRQILLYTDSEETVRPGWRDSLLFGSPRRWMTGSWRRTVCGTIFGRGAFQARVDPDGLSAWIHEKNRGGMNQVMPPLPRIQGLGAGAVAPASRPQNGKAERVLQDSGIQAVSDAHRLSQGEVRT